LIQRGGPLSLTLSPLRRGEGKGSARATNNPEPSTAYNLSVYREIRQCCICGNPNLETVLDLGVQALTGVFPKSRDEPVGSGPLQLARCTGGAEVCGLVQLRHSYDAAEMYGSNYGYRSSLNPSMVKHLGELVARMRTKVELKPDDVVLDIGSNDGTLLSFYQPGGPILLGMDPSAAKFRSYYRPDIQVITDFFSAARFQEAVPGRKAKIVTSIAMFYDLEDPQAFVREVEQILADDGVWHFEQSYLPSMIEANAYDTVCHEHLEYYALRQIDWMMKRAGLKIIDLYINDVNGGSFGVTVAKRGSRYPESGARLEQMLAAERKMGLETPAALLSFAKDVERHRTELKTMLSSLIRSGKRVFGYGASTKGNVLLQYCGLGPKDIPYIAEVNEDKFGSVTPGTHIPIISEAEARAMKPDVFLVMPWHFRRHIVARESEFLNQGGELLFPLPHPEIVKR